MVKSGRMFIMAGMCVLLLTVPVMLYAQPAKSESGTFYRLCDKHTLVPVLSFGNTGDDSTMVFQPRELLIGLSSDFYVLDYDDKRIKQYDNHGNYQGYFGGYGQGPGEIMSCNRMRMGPDGTIVIYDYKCHRFSFFSPDGRFLHMKRDKSFKRAKGFIEGFIVLTDTTIILETEVPERPSSKGHDFESGGITEISATYYLDGLNLSTLTLHTFDSCDVASNFVIGYSLAPRPFPGDFLWGVQPEGGIVTVDSYEAFGEIYDKNGIKLRQFPLDIKRKRVTERDLEDFFSQDWVKKYGALRLRQQLTLPKYKPVCEALFIDESGCILLRGRAIGKNTSEYHVYSPEGEKIGRFRMPYLSADAKFQDGYVYDLVRPDDAYAYVVKYEVR